MTHPYNLTLFLLSSQGIVHHFSMWISCLPPSQSQNDTMLFSFQPTDFFLKNSAFKITQRPIFHSHSDAYIMMALKINSINSPQILLLLSQATAIYNYNIKSWDT